MHRLGPVRPGEGLADRLGVVQPGRQEEGQRGPDEEVVEVAGHLLVEPGELVVVEHRAPLRLEHPRGPGVEHDQPRPAEGPGVAPAVTLGLTVHPLREGTKGAGQVDLARPGAVEPGPDLIAGELLGREVADVLVHPVARQPRDQPLVPPRGAVDLLVPRPRGVPVVADVVVVEDHRARHDREHPPDGRVAPRELVEVRVLRVVLDLLARRLVEAAPRGDEVTHLRARLVGVDLVTEEGEDVGSWGLPLRQGQSEGAQRVDAVARVVLRVVRDARAAGAEGEQRRTRAVQRRDARGRQVGPGRRPHLLVVDAHHVVVGTAGLEVVEQDEGVVVALHDEARGVPRAAVGRDGHPRGGGGLHPDGGVVLTDEAQEGTEDERGRGGHPLIVSPVAVSRLAGGCVSSPLATPQGDDQEDERGERRGDLGTVSPQQHRKGGRPEVDRVIGRARRARGRRGHGR